MRYKILTYIALLTILPAAYAIDKPAEPPSNGAANLVDPYQYCFKNSTWIVPPATLLASTIDTLNWVQVSLLL